LSRKLIDLTLTITPKVAWAMWPGRLIGQEEPPVLISGITTLKDDGIFNSKFQMPTQGFTHMDAPSHHIEGGLNNEQVPLESMVGEGVVLDVAYKKPREGVTVEDLEKTRADVRPGDFAIIRTGWTEDAPWGTERFWTEMVYLDGGIGSWLVEKKVGALVFDCYPGFPFLRKCEHGGYEVKYRENPTSRTLLSHGIPLFSFCTNLRAISKPRVTVVALPLKLKGTDGAPARVIAIEEN
jgi:arylformamidase